MPRFFLTAQARLSLATIGEYTQRQWGIAQKERYLRAIDHCFQRLAANPLLGKSRDDIHSMVRSHTIEKHVIYYRIMHDDISILDVLHEKMDPIRYLN